ncbi:MAG TPA: hypothetical protein VHB25_00300 [Gemmatimonadaceae bacterium]|nr:hypothetical protein [Gemmatimonadaceae bacterium]
MNERFVKVLVGAAGLLIGAGACQHQVATVARTTTAPVLPPEVSPPTMQPATVAAPPGAAVEDTSREQHVTIDTHGGELDVRQVLDFLAKQGHFSLVYSPQIKKQVRLQLNDVPLSVALQTVLTMANLTLESTTEPPQSPASTSVVFYQLPVNVDSLSVEAIMKRFSVGRGIAELIVQSRVERP